MYRVRITVPSLLKSTEMSKLGKLKYAQKLCLGKVGKLMHEQKMIDTNAKIGVAVSGGADSWVLLQTLILRKRIVPFSFDIMALHIGAGFETKSGEVLQNWLKKNGIAAHIEIGDIGLRAHSAENKKKSTCFFCAWHRRKRLFELCKRYNLTHLAFGHHADDLITTFFMNLVQTGKVWTLPAKERYFDGQLTLLRPLLLLEKKEIELACKQWNLPITENLCPSSGKTLRTEIAKDIQTLIKKNKNRKTNIKNGLLRWQLAGEENGSV